MNIKPINAQKVDVGLTKVTVELFGAGYGPAWGWDPPEGKTFYNVELCAFMIASGNGKTLSDEYFIFFNNPDSPDGALTLDYIGYDSDCPLTKGLLSIDLTKVSHQIDEIVLILSIDTSGINFGYEESSLIHIYETLTNHEMCRYNLGIDFQAHTALEFGKLMKKGDIWMFEAIGIGHKENLAAFVTKYGLSVA